MSPDRITQPMRQAIYQLQAAGSWQKWQASTPTMRALMDRGLVSWSKEKGYRATPKANQFFNAGDEE